MRVLKFGGKSLSNPEKVYKICKFIKQIYKSDKELVVVVSAMGHTTDNLIKEAKVYSNNAPTPREMDVLLSTGETQSAALFAMALNSISVPAKSLQAFQLQIKTFGAHENSKLTSINKQPLLECFNQNIVAVITGFQGINSEGDTTTLGRGGSDTTACAIAASLNSDVEIYSDFNGVYRGDPRLLNYKKIKHLNYTSMQNLSDHGAKVLASRAIMLAQKHDIKIMAKCASNPHLCGSIISKLEDNIIAITSKENLAQISVVYSDNTNLELIVKNVINCIKSYNFYNLEIKQNTLSFLISMQDYPQIISIISQKLNLLKH